LDDVWILCGRAHERPRRVAEGVTRGPLRDPLGRRPFRGL